MIPELFAPFTATAVITLAVTETVIKPISTRLFRRYAPATLALFMARADDLLFWAIEHDKTRDEYEAALCLWMEEQVGDQWGPQDCDRAFGGGYDPRIALEHCSRT